MSGLEVVGVVLGLFPVVISALGQVNKVAKRVGQFKDIQLEHMKCFNELEYQRIIFNGHLQWLLPLVVEEAEIPALVADPAGAAWKEPRLEQRLERRLGHSLRLYMIYLDGMKIALEQLSHELALDSAPIQSKLKALVR
jgi:hypothetical protein